MAQVLKYAPRVAIFVLGMAAGALTRERRELGGMNAEAEKEVKRSMAELEKRVAAQVLASANRLAQIEARLDEHASKLAELPSTQQIVGAMEQLLSRTMSSLDDRLTSQAASIEILRTAVTQTDSLLERVLESLDSLQTSDPELAPGAPVHRPVA
jgi:chromosome segregation ATPase